MDSSSHKGFSLIDGGRINDPAECLLVKFVYEPTEELSTTVGFALIENQPKPRRAITRFAPRLELVDSITSALRTEPFGQSMKRVEPGIIEWVGSGTDLYVFPTSLGIRPELKIDGPHALSTHNFIEEADRQSEKLFPILDLWAKANPRPKTKEYGQPYIQRSIRNAFLDRGLWRHKALDKQISIERFVSDYRLRTIFLAYKDLRNYDDKIYRLLHPVSVYGSSTNTQVLAENWPLIRDGVENELQMRCEIRAIVENAPQNASKNRVEALRTLESAGITVAKVEALHALAADAEAALRFV